MPAPSTIVTFIDADGDEFPIRVEGSYGSLGAERIEVVDIAGRRLEQFRSEDVLRPTYPVRVGSIEEG